MLRLLRDNLEQLGIPFPLPLGSLPGSPSPQTSKASIPTWIPTSDLHILEASQIGLND